MRLRANAYVYLAIMAIMLFAILWTQLGMKYGIQSKLLPTLIGSIVFLIATVGLWVEVRKEKKAGKEEKKTAGEAKETWRRSLVNFSWVIGFLLGIYLLGYTIAIVIFVSSYMKWLGTRWLTAIVWAVVTSAAIYSAFQFGLQLPLYKGIIPEWLMG
ncbi:MAG: tripartite tricarboxylate transporter TctB family protein [Chloroflexota bacterium]